MYNSILLALDGSEDSLEAGRLAIISAKNTGATILATHVYDLAIHEERFIQMEPGLPKEYREKGMLGELRSSHDLLMTDGFKALSRGYMNAFIDHARSTGVEVEELVIQGRNYTRLLEAVEERRPDLVAIGARGLGGATDDVDERLGSVATRLLRSVSTDLLIARAAGEKFKGPVTVGIDGSDDALFAMEKAQKWAGWFDTGLSLVAAYDPSLHQQVFKTMASAMPLEAQEAAGLDKQESLHESLIDDGLAVLYREFLKAAVKRTETPVAHHLVAEKAHLGLLARAKEDGAVLLAVGRFGHHREERSTLGANAERVASRYAGSVLVTTAPDTESPSAEGEGPVWDEDAEARLGKAPRFARKMARRGVENYAESIGAKRVTLELYEEAVGKLGMGRRK